MLPNQIRTTTVTLGPFVDDVGAPWPGRVTVTSSTPRVWAATGAVVAPRAAPVPLDDDGRATLRLPFTDQPGFTDGAGRALTGWTYTLALTLDGQEYARHTFALPSRLASSDGVHVDLLPGAATVGARGAGSPGAAPGPTGRARRAGADGPSAGTALALVPAVPDVPPARGVSRRDAFRAGMVALGAGAAISASASASAAHGPAPARPAGVLPLAQTINDDLVIGSTATPRTLTVKSSGAGGTESGPSYYDSTGRIVLEAYQPHFRWYGESIRVQLKDPRAKGMLTYQAHWPQPHYPDGDFTGRPTHPSFPVTIAWIGAHFLDNDDPSLLRNNLKHGHLNFEVPDSRGDLQTRLEIKIIDTTTGKIGTDRSAVRTNMADFEVGVGTQHEQMRIVGNDTRPKDLAFSLQHGPTQPRWVLRTTPQGANFQFLRYLSDARLVDAPLQLDRESGRVTVGGDDGTAAGLLVRRNGAAPAVMVETLAARGGQGVLVRSAAGDLQATAVQTDVVGDTQRRFVVTADGTHQWGDGAAARDTQLYRRSPNQVGTDGGVFLRSSGTPATASTGGVLFVQDGALRYRGSRGTVTTIAPA
ncbi:hypothetical protein [Cellulomonas sp. SLBN-39]|uniref:hypothetical protein n=1 Tax=Cellulomonas sp. SLBN-39 TaxID=2768446 RepID=UPI001171884C|nr:hypothetical protein [Cellulomonas sp. SLBN-39]TQL03161.1 hypothetical protein FBY24_2255 [Cellulomonas sp. SLBN-39]